MGCHFFLQGIFLTRDQTQGSCIGRRTLLPLSHQGRVKCLEVKEDCCCSVAQSCWTLCESMDCGTPGPLVLYHLPELAQIMFIELVMPSNHLVLCHPLLLPSIFLSLRIFSNESVLHVRWPKYWSFSFSISPSNEQPGLISFRMDCLDLPLVQGILKSLIQHHSSKASILWCSVFFMVQLSHLYMTMFLTNV